MVFIIALFTFNNPLYFLGVAEFSFRVRFIDIKMLILFRHPVGSDNVIIVFMIV